MDRADNEQESLDAAQGSAGTQISRFSQAKWPIYTRPSGHMLSKSKPAHLMSPNPWPTPLLPAPP